MSQLSRCLFQKTLDLTVALNSFRWGVAYRSAVRNVELEALWTEYRSKCGF
jgi:hypothetical protein